jgi:hypothetical protein
MNIEEIVKGNKLIAEFMELPLRKMIDGDNVTYCRYSDYEDLQYHTSWDWLMPCFAKFNDMVKTEEIEHDMESSAIHDLLEYSILAVEIKAAHNYFVQLIEWYNQTKKQTNG